MIIWAVIQTFFSSMDQVFYKKTLTFSPKNLPFSSFSIFSEWLVALLLAIFVWMDFSNMPLFIALVSVAVINYMAWFVQLKAVTEEKMSVLIPYSKLDSVFIVMVSFFIFKDGTMFSFLICLLMLFMSVFSNVDFKTFNFSSWTLLYMLAKILFSVNWIFVWYALSKLDMMSFFIQNSIAYYLLTFIPILMLYKKFNKQDFLFQKWFYISSYISSFSRLVWFFIWAFIMQKLWLVLSTMLWFIWTWVTLLMSYFMLKDTPSSKDLILTMIMTMLVFMWFYFK